MNVKEQLQFAYETLKHRYGTANVEVIAVPLQYEGLDPIECMVYAFESKHIERSSDGFIWHKDFSGFKIFVDMIELLAIP